MFVCLRDACSHLVLALNPKTIAIGECGLDLYRLPEKISPEQVREKQFVKEKQIKDGTKPLLDDKGVQVKDSEGKPMVVDVMKTISASIYEFTQFKSVQTIAKVEFHDLNTKQLIDAYPLSSEFVFNYIYANYNGDKRACEQDYFQYFDTTITLD